jgi:hypothetical protein
MFLESAWYMFPILATIAMFLSGTIIGLFKVEKDWPRRIISWIVPAVLAVAAYFLKMYEVTAPEWLGVLTMWFAVAFASNGVFGIPQIKAFIEMLFKYVPQPAKKTRK